MHQASFLHKNLKTLKSRPLIVGTLTGRGNLKQQIRLAKSSSVDLLEVRLDTFLLPQDVSLSVSFSKQLLRKIKKMSHMPLLLTLRSPRESGSPVSSRRHFSDGWRFDVVKKLVPLIDAIDLELSSSPLVRKLSPLVRRHRVGVIGSAHNFSRVPSMTSLRKIEKQFRGLRADVLKVAVMPRTEQELREFLRWGLRVKGPVILIGMGPIGSLSRILGFSFGSILTYGHLGKSAAPGQLSVKELSDSVRRIYG